MQRMITTGAGVTLESMVRGPVLVLVLLLVGGCGFQLRGALDIPPEFTPVFVQAGGAVGLEIKQRVADSGVALASAPGDAGLILRVLSERRDSRIVAVDRDGRALAFELIYIVSFDALGREGRVLLATQTLSAERTFDDNPDVAVLGKQLESEIIFQDMVADVADRILLRLRAVLSPGES